MIRRSFCLLFLALSLCSLSFADYGFIWYDIAVSELPAACTPGQLFMVNDATDVTDCSAGSGASGAICRCDEAGTGYTAVPITPTLAKWDRAALAVCSASTQDEVRVDASGDLCFCNGSSWALVSGGGTCDVVANSYLLMETGSYVLMETGSKIILESSP